MLRGRAAVGRSARRALAGLADGDQRAGALAARPAGSLPRGRRAARRGATRRPGNGGWPARAAGDHEAHAGRRRSPRFALRLDADPAAAQLPGDVAGRRVRRRAARSRRGPGSSRRRPAAAARSAPASRRSARPGRWRGRAASRRRRRRGRRPRPSEPAGAWLDGRLRQPASRAGRSPGRRAARRSRSPWRRCRACRRRGRRRRRARRRRGRRGSRSRGGASSGRAP